MPTFANTLNPTPFGLFNSDLAFQTEADAMVTFVKRKLGDDILSVELTKKQVWACFEESLMEYGSIINTYQAESNLMNLMGFPTGSSISGSLNIGPHGYESMLPRETMEFLNRQAEPYASDAGIGGSYDAISGSISLKSNILVPLPFICIKSAGEKIGRIKPIFKISASIPNSKKFIGTGNSKQQAEQDGAKKLLENIKIV